MPGSKILITAGDVLACQGIHFLLLAAVCPQGDQGERVTSELRTARDTFHLIVGSSCLPELALCTM